MAKLARNGMKSKEKVPNDVKPDNVDEDEKNDLPPHDENAEQGERQGPEPNPSDDEGLESDFSGRDNNEKEEKEETSSNDSKAKGQKRKPGPKSKTKRSNEIARMSTGGLPRQKRPQRQLSEKKTIDKKSNSTKEKEYEVEKILATRVKKNGVREFSIKWKGYRQLTWEPENNLECPDLVKAFMAAAAEKGPKEKEARGRSNSRKKVGSTIVAKKGPKRKLSAPAKPSKKAKKEKSDDETENYEVDKIVGVRFMKNGKREFEIQWKGYAQHQNTWEPEDNLDCQDALESFVAKVGAKLKNGGK